MKESLKIKNFGPIKEANIEIKPLMVFIGESGSGKSAILKLMSLLRWVHKQSRLATFFKEDINDNIFSDNLEISEINSFISKETEIEFNLGCSTYRLEKEIFYPGICSEITFDKVLFLSENRGILPNILNQDFGLNVKFPYHLEDTFFNFKEAIDKKKDFFIEATGLTLSQEKENCKAGVCGKGGGFNMIFVYSSSGTKLSSWWVLVVNYITQEYNFNKVLENANKRRGLGSGRIGKDFDNAKNLSIFIEEPELSLFPSAQRRLINRLVRDCFNENKQKDCIIRLAFATHSPYIVNHLNLLIEAFDKQNTEFTDSASISYDNLGVWLIENGKLRDLKAKNQHFIDVMPLSDDINDIYDKYKVLKNG